jgi:hypothetical protein
MRSGEKECAREKVSGLYRDPKDTWQADKWSDGIQQRRCASHTMAPAYNDEGNAYFSSLPVFKRRWIDSAFDSVAKSARSDSLDDDDALNSGAAETVTPGGFVASDVLAGAPSCDAQGETSGSGALSYIPLSAVPQALQILDIQPDDLEILSVFQKAASGWGTGSQGQVKVVSRDDFRSVCAVLLEGEEDPEGGDSDVDAESDEYRGSSDVENVDEDDDDDDDDDDDYAEDTSPKRRRKAPRSVPISSQSPGSDLPSTSRGLTSRQARDCRRAFALFFPGIDETRLGEQKITSSVLARAAADLKEKLKLDDVCPFSL